MIKSNKKRRKLMKTEEKLQKLKEKMSAAEYRLHLITLKKEAELTENIEDLNIIKKEIATIDNEAKKETEKIVDDFIGFIKGFTEFITEEVSGERKPETKVVKNDEKKPVPNEEKDLNTPLSNGETLILSKEFIANGEIKKYKIEVISSPQGTITFYQLKVKVEAGRDKVFDTLARFKKNNGENFSEFFASELIKNCDFYLENRMKEEEILTEERFLNFLKEFGYKFII